MGAAAGRPHTHALFAQLAHRDLALVGVEPVEHEHTVEVIGLVQEDPTEQLVALDDDFVPVEVDAPAR